MKCESLFSGKNHISCSSAEFAYRMVRLSMNKSCVTTVISDDIVGCNSLDADSRLKKA